jgi:FkbM family methyltransferase
MDGASDSFPAGWRHKVRAHVVKLGIRVVLGRSDIIPTSAADDVSLISGGLRMAWLRTLGSVGVRNIVTSSGLGYDFVCHIGDLAEYPYYHRRAFEKELALAAAWLRHTDKPVVYDLGANVGFISTHLAQMLADRSPRIYAFEPVPATFGRLVESIQRLGLSDRVHPIAAAVCDHSRPVRLAYSRWNSLEAQVISDALSLCPPDAIVNAAGTTLDEFGAAMDTHPSLVKMDIEGCEVAALRGSRRMLARDDRPAILFEHNPTTLQRRGATTQSFRELLADYALYYVDDLMGQRMPFGGPVADIAQVQWICNLFAIPRMEGSAGRWESTLSHARSLMDGRARNPKGLLL